MAFHSFDFVLTCRMLFQKLVRTKCY